MLILGNLIFLLLVLIGALQGAAKEGRYQSRAPRSERRTRAARRASVCV